MAINEKFEAGLLAAEADAFWSLSKLLANVEDTFSETQPAVNKTINNMAAIVKIQD